MTPEGDNSTPEQLADQFVGIIEQEIDLEPFAPIPRRLEGTAGKRLGEGALWFDKYKSPDIPSGWIVSLRLQLDGLTNFALTKDGKFIRCIEKSQGVCLKRELIPNEIEALLRFSSDPDSNIDLLRQLRGLNDQEEALMAKQQRDYQRKLAAMDTDGSVVAVNSRYL